MRFRDTFKSQWEQYSERDGQSFEVLETLTHETHPDEVDEECGTVYSIRFPDGEVVTAWPEEVEAEYSEVFTSLMGT